MKTLLIYVLLFFSLHSVSSVDEVVKALKDGNASLVSKFFDNTVEITLPDKSNSYSKSQASLVLQDFFTNSGVRNFQVLHKGDNSGSQYCIGILNTRNGEYRTTIFLKLKGETQFLQEIKFENSSIRSVFNTGNLARCKVPFFMISRYSAYFCPMNYDEQLELLIRNALQEDIGTGDHSTLATIDKGAKGKAVLKIKENGILAGMEVANRIFAYVQKDAVFTPTKQDGDEMKAGETAFEVQADVHTILTCERLVLNCMQRMSGIATLTRSYVDKLKGYDTKLLDTRKTTPNFRLLEKEAVRIGGGTNHRFGLFDMIMLKDNHIDYCGGIEKAIDKANQYITSNHLDLKIEVETRSIADVRKVMATGRVNRIMLDNLTPGQLSEALKLIGKKYETEASGGINLDNIQQYAETGVDYISSGAIIHQARSLDLSLKAVLL